MKNQIYFLDQSLALFLIILISSLFALIGVLHSRKYQSLSNYLTANRNVGTITLVASRA